LYMLAKLAYHRYEKRGKTIPVQFWQRQRIKKLGATMTTVKERVIAYVGRNLGLTETEIAEALFGPGAYQQRVNPAVRSLIEEGRVVKRTRYDGSTGVYPARGGVPPPDSAREASRILLARGDTNLSSNLRRRSESPGKRDPGSINWSAEYVLTRESVENRAPIDSGVYEILQSVEYPRFEGRTCTLKIGRSKTGLKSELLNHFGRHVAANRLERIRLRQGIQVMFRFAVLGPDAIALAEKTLLRQFEDRHWDLPVLNSQRGYLRGEDRHYRYR